MKFSTGLLDGFRRIAKLHDATDGENALDVDRLAWMAGDWHNTDRDEFSQESWLKPVKGCMSGTFRKISNERLVMHEYRFFARESGHIMLRCRRYFGDQPAKREPENVILCLAEMRHAYAVFENTEPVSEAPHRIIYQRSDDRLIVTATSGRVAHGNAERSEFHLAPR